MEKFSDGCGLGLYVHVPFCASSCAFCAFHREPPLRKSIELFLHCLELEWRLRRVTEPVETIFFGGGTPGILTAADFSHLAKILGIGRNLQPEEWTVEFSPATVKREKLAVLRQLGVTRISMGVQSFNANTLATLGRRQTPDQIFRAYDLIRSFNFSVNLDLIFNIPGQTMLDWEQDLLRAVTMAPDHISTYCLSGEEGTPLEKKLSVDHATSGENFYRKTWKILRAAGFEHYEISNFSRAGHRCRHNCNTWRMGQWLGLGPSAASQFRHRRFRNENSLDCWADGIQKNAPAEEDVVVLTDKILLQDKLIFGLRMGDGIRRDLLDAAEVVGFSRYGVLFRRWLRWRFLEIRGENFCPTDRGMLLSDALALEILENAT